MILNYDSYYKKLANLAEPWEGTDTKQLYEHNLKHRYNDLNNNGWIENSFLYKYNSHGFRCEEFSDRPGIMFLGCSMTFGTGLPEESRWTNIVSSTLNLRCYNLGIGGSSSDTAFRLCHGWIDKINPKIVIFRRPPGIRMEHVTNTTVKNLHQLNRNDSTMIKWWGYDDDTNSELNFLKNHLAISYMCSVKNIKFVQEVTEKENHCDLARDLMHHGVTTNKIFAEQVLSHI